MDKSMILNKVYGSKLPSRAVLVIMYLINRSNKEFTCFPAIPTIAKETNICVRTVQRAMKDLLDAGFIEKSSRYRENRGQSSNLYTLVLPDDNRVDMVDKSLSESDSALGDIESIDFSFYKCDKVEVGGSVVIDKVDSWEKFTIGRFYLDCHGDGDTYVPP